MKHLRTFENFDQDMQNHMHGQPSEEEMMDHLCACGYNEMDVMEMDAHELADAYERSKMSNESRYFRKNRRYESFDREMMNNTHENPSEEEMMDYLCACGYNEMDVMEMDAHELAHEYEICQMETNEARRYKRKQAEKKASKKAKPDFLDIDKDGDKKETMKKAYADKKSTQGKGSQDGSQKKSQSEAQGKLSAAQKKLPPALQKAIANKKK